MRMTPGLDDTSAPSSTAALTHPSTRCWFFAGLEIAYFTPGSARGVDDETNFWGHLGISYDKTPNGSQHLPACSSIFCGCVLFPRTGIAESAGSRYGQMDFYAKPLPEIPLPNDVATRYDSSSPTKRRINASMVAPTNFEATARELIDNIDGWGVGQPITIPFTGPISVSRLSQATEILIMTRAMT